MSSYLFDPITGEIAFIPGSTSSGPPGPQGPQGPAGINGFATVYQTPPLTAEQVLAGEVELPITPDAPEKVLCTPIHGTPQRYGGPPGSGLPFPAADFTVSGNVLSWAGLGMQPLMNVGDILLITY